MSKITKLNAYLHTNQYQNLNRLLASENKILVEEIIDRNLNIINSIPNIYDRKKLDVNTIAFIHYFHKGYDCFVTNIDKEQLKFFGLVILSNNIQKFEYISMRDLTDTIYPVELNLNFLPLTLKEIREKYL